MSNLGSSIGNNIECSMGSSIWNNIGCSIGSSVGSSIGSILGSNIISVDFSAEFHGQPLVYIIIPKCACVCLSVCAGFI